MSPLSAVSLGDALQRLLDRQPFWNGQRIHHRLAALQKLHDVAHGGPGLDLVLAGLQRRIIAEGAHAEPEDPGVADQSAALELVGDILDAGVRLDQERVAIGRRAGLGELLLAEIERDAGRQNHQHHQGDDEVHEHDDLAARSARALRRRRAGFGPQRLAGRLRHDRARRRRPLPEFSVARRICVHRALPFDLCDESPAAE